MMTAEGIQQKSWQAAEKMVDKAREADIQKFKNEVMYVEEKIKDASNNGGMSTQADVTSSFSDRIVRIFENRGFYIKRHYWLPILLMRSNPEAEDTLIVSWNPKKISKLDKESKFHKWMRLHNVFTSYNIMQVFFSCLVFFLLILSVTIVGGVIMKIFGTVFC